MANYEEEELPHDPSEETLTIEARFQPLLTETMTKSKDGFLGVSWGLGDGTGGATDVKPACVYLLLWTGLCHLLHHIRVPRVPTASKKSKLAFQLGLVGEQKGAARAPPLHREV